MIIVVRILHHVHQVHITPYYFEINAAQMAVQNQAHPRDHRNARNPMVDSVWSPMATLNFTLTNSLCCCFDLYTAFEVGWI